MKLQILPASAGIAWVKLGIQTFFKQPLALGGLFFMFLACLSVISIIPVLGSPLSLVLIPGATLGLMVATLEALRGKFPMPSTLLVGFRSGPGQLKSMLILGVIYAAAFSALVWIAGSIGGDSLAQLDLSDPEKTRKVIESGDWSSAVLSGAAMYLVLSMFFWHAPGLVHWYNMPPMKALFFSMIACVRNFKAYAVYGLTWMAVLLVASITLGTVMGLLGLQALGRPIITAFALSMAAMTFASVYFTFRDSFIHNDLSEQNPSELHPPEA
jgi:hypothetical protein